MTHYAIWPEGLPGEAIRTDGWLKANAILGWQQISQLFPLSKARRMRVATCEDGMPDPHAAEAALERAGAIAPPGGWPRPRFDDGGHQGPRADVRISTLSVV